MEKLHKQSERLIAEYTNYAIEQSETYADAIAYINKTASLTIHGQAIKKAIQDEITRCALNSRIRLERNNMKSNHIFHGNEKPTNAVEGDCWYRNGELLVFKNDWERFEEYE